MTETNSKNKSIQYQQENNSEEEEEEEDLFFEIDDVSTWLENNEEEQKDTNDNNSQAIKTPDRKPTRTLEDLLKSSPPSPLFYDRKKRKVPLPKPPVFKIEKNDKKISTTILDDDLDLDASVAAIFKRNRSAVKRTKQDIVKPVMMECPICSRMFLKEKIEIHASDCTGAYSDDDDDGSEMHGTRKKTISSGIAKSEAIRKKKFKNVQQFPINYYLQSEDMVNTDGGDFASSSSGLQWESAGQTRFS